MKKQKTPDSTAEITKMSYSCLIPLNYSSIDYFIQLQEDVNTLLSDKLNVCNLVGNYKKICLTCFWPSCHVEDLYQSAFEEASKVDAAGKLEMWDYLKLNIHIRNIVAAAVLGKMKNKKLIIFIEE